MGIVAFILGMLITLVGSGKAASHDVIVIPPMPQHAPVMVESTTVQDAYDDAWCEFTNLFNAYQVKRAKNGALMIRSGNAGSYRFAKKG